jgi:hypothetical protein
MYGSWKATAYLPRVGGESCTVDFRKAVGLLTMLATLQYSQHKTVFMPDGLNSFVALRRTAEPTLGHDVFQVRPIR